ncbi:MAG TPA: hypothetical protein VMF90_24925 [Rhizobiaceae bacterium]|nr:hypothetical protein [Rhizobiaceae bacterium]
MTETSPRQQAGVAFHWTKLPPRLETLTGVVEDAEELYLRREKPNAHRGIARFAGLKRFWASKVNQDFLDEIAALENLELLHIGSTTATSFAPLARLKNLRRLIVIGGTKVESLEWFHDLPQLEVLFLERFKRVPALSWATGLTKLTAFGFEGGLDNRVTVESLAPLSALSGLRYLFLASTNVVDRRLKPLHALRHLTHLDCALAFPDEEYFALHHALPNLKCEWFDMIDRHGSTKAGMAAFMRRLREK